MDEIEQVKAKTDIVELIGQYVKLSKAGRNFKGLCPFHNEKSPSFVISPERQIWHCFGCNKGGDAISFVEEYDRIDFAEALKFLAQKAGVTLSGPVHKTEREKKKDALYELNHLAQQFYSYLLTEHKVGKKALAYLTDERKLPLALIKKFGIGYAPTGENMLAQYLNKKKKYSLEDIIDAGLASSGRVVTDFFRGRVVFPIHDVRGNIIAFSGRGLDDQTFPKYVNTRETKLYRKSESLYGIFFAKEEIRTQKHAILVEGEFDVLTSFREGISNIVAVKGTALTLEQIKLLKRFTEKISFCFDTDPAGTAAQRRSIQLIEQEKIATTVILPPEGKDPDELLNSDPALFKKAIKNDINIYEYIIQTAFKSNNKETAEGKKKILEDTLPYLAAIENEVVKEHHLRKLAEQLDTSFESVMKQSQKILKPQKNFDEPEQVKKAQPRNESLACYMVAILVQAPQPFEAITRVKVAFDGIPLNENAYLKVLKQLLTYDALEFNIQNFAKELPAELYAAFDTCFLLPLPEIPDPKDYAKEVNLAALDLRNLILKERIQTLVKGIGEQEENNNQAELEKLQTEFSTLTALLNRKIQIS